MKRRTNDCRKRNQCCLLCWRTAAVSHRSLCPAEHLPLQIDYPGGSPRRTQTTAAALIKSQTQVRCFPRCKRSKYEPGTSDIYRGLRMTTRVVIVERDEWKYIFLLLLLWVAEFWKLSGLSQIKQKQMTLGLLCSKSKKIHLNVSFQKSWPGYWRYPTNLVVSGFTKDDFFFHPRKVPIAKRINLVGGSTIIKFLIYEHKCVFQPGDGTNMILQAWLHAKQANLSIFSAPRSFEELICLLHSAKEERSQTSHRRKLVCGLFCLHTITSSWTEWVEPQCAFLLPKAN